ncbi:MAG: hypothetical protein VB042_08600 [Victivallaceae bacterium]|nr:hypothetical protein [Victivallaceae bacterium]
MKKHDIRCARRECRWCYIPVFYPGNPDFFPGNPDVLGMCERPAMVEIDIFTGECLDFEPKD